MPPACPTSTNVTCRPCGSVSWEAASGSGSGQPWSRASLRRRHHTACRLVTVFPGRTWVGRRVADQLAPQKLDLSAAQDGRDAEKALLANLGRFGLRTSAHSSSPRPAPSARTWTTLWPSSRTTCSLRIATERRRSLLSMHSSSTTLWERLLIHPRERVSNQISLHRRAEQVRRHWHVEPKESVVGLRLCDDP